MTDTTLKDVLRTAKLFSLPEIYHRLKNLLKEPDFAMAEVAVIISQDPAITLRLLRMVNSSLYGLSTKVETVSRAITLLGTQQIHDLVLATSVTQSFDRISINVMDMMRFWRRSVYCGMITRQLAIKCGGCDPEHLFIAGLLHDIGHLIMYQAIPDLSQQALLTARKSREPLFETERELIGFDSAEIGGELMRQWFLPDSLWETTMFHTEPWKAEQYPLETSLVHLGSLLMKADDEKSVFNEGSLTTEPVVWSVTGLSLEICALHNEQAKKDTSEAMNLMFLSK